MKRFSVSMLAMIALGALVGCANTRTVTFVVSATPRGEAQSGPVSGAHVRAVSLNTGQVSLPLNRSTINELLTKELAQNGTTRGDGRASVELPSGVPHLVEVVPPPIGLGSSMSRAVYVLDADGTTLTARGEVTYGEPLVLEVAR